jgi:outer membrane protein insertion porin family
VDVVFVLDEKPALRRISVSGNRELGAALITRELEVRPGELVDATRLRRNAARIRAMYVDRGHFVAEVDPELRPAPDDSVDVVFRIREGPRASVARVSFSGNRAFSDAELSGIISTRPPGFFSVFTGAGRFREDVLERDAALLRAYYYDRGFVDARIEPPRVTLSADRSRVQVRFEITEGRVHRFGRVEVAGDLLEPRATILARLRTRPGELFSRARLAQDVEDLTRTYKDRGFAYANVAPETSVRATERLVDVTIEMDRGPGVTIERIEITGNKKTRDEVIRRQLRVREGDRYGESRLEQSRRRIAALGYFERVELATRRGSADDRMTVTFTVIERSTGTVQFGVGFSSTERVLLQGQLSEGNLFGRGQTLALVASFSSFRRLFLLQFQEPYLLHTRWAFGFSLYDQNRSYTAFRRSSTGGTLTFGRELTDDLRAFLIQTVEYVQVEPRRRTAIAAFAQSLPSLLRDGLTSAPQLLVTYDTRDNRLYPTRGSYDTASFEIADRYTGSQNDFTRAELTVRYFRPVIGPFILRTRVLGGLVMSRDPRGVPLGERYFGGGIFDVRGFTPRSLSPRILVPEGLRPDLSLTTFPVGGNLHLLGNAELEFAIYDRIGIRGVVFTDAGNTFNLEEQYCRLRPPDAAPSIDPCIAVVPLDSLRYSWGFGVRWFSPLGPLRFEWGIPFRTRPGEDPVVFEFTIGNAF